MRLHGRSRPYAETDMNHSEMLTDAISRLRERLAVQETTVNHLSVTVEHMRSRNHGIDDRLNAIAASLAGTKDATFHSHQMIDVQFNRLRKDLERLQLELDQLQHLERRASVKPGLIPEVTVDTVKWAGAAGIFGLVATGHMTVGQLRSLLGLG